MIAWLVFSVVVAGMVGLAFYLGTLVGSKIAANREPVAKTARKRYSLRFRPDDLLDPISPADQRLEKELEVKHSGSEED
jgi:hypothetical protein